MKKYNYDIEEYNFADLVREALECELLNEAHCLLPEDVEYNEVFNIDNDNATWFHKKFYNRLNDGWEEFMNVYDSFVENEVSKHFDDKLVYQARPTFRIHLPDNVAVGAYENRESGFHRDSDPGYDHPVEEINIYLPLTEAFGTNTLWAETEEGKEDYKPMSAAYGEYYIWKGSKLSHGNKLNSTNQTRVSFDFRIIPKSSYNPEDYKTSRSANKKFVIGDYYSEVR